ncbi:hypothetical protein [Bacillus marinisedimentorum]|nr:hypothetical protein [Bacillus marinisedimentorum]
MEKEKETVCNEEQDRLNHYLIDMVTKVIVEEQEEQMKEELEEGGK